MRRELFRVPAAPVAVVLNARRLGRIEKPEGVTLGDKLLQLEQDISSLFNYQFQGIDSRTPGLCPSIPLARSQHYSCGPLVPLARAEHYSSTPRREHRSRIFRSEQSLFDSLRRQSCRTITCT